LLLLYITLFSLCLDVPLSEQHSTIISLREHSSGGWHLHLLAVIALVIPPVYQSTLIDLAFRVATSWAWNSLSSAVQARPSVFTFWRQLNTFFCFIYVNNNNNSHDNVYGAVIMTKVIARVHPVHLMNVD